MKTFSLTRRLAHDDDVDSERGSAVVDFVLVATIVTLLAMSIIQLAIILHVRNVAIDAASSGARYGSLADRTAADAQSRAGELMRNRLGDAYAQSIDVEEVVADGTAQVTVTVRAPMPVLGLIGPAGVLEVRGHATSPQ